MAAGTPTWPPAGARRAALRAPGWGPAGRGGGRKAPGVEESCPGCVVNRLLWRVGNEAGVALTEGAASAAGSDGGMRLGCNHPIGPLALADMIGLDGMLAVMNVFDTDFNDPKYRPALLLKEMVAAGYLGRKTGRGLFRYDCWANAGAPEPAGSGDWNDCPCPIHRRGIPVRGRVGSTAGPRRRRAPAATPPRPVAHSAGPR